MLTFILGALSIAAFLFAINAIRDRMWFAAAIFLVAAIGLAVFVDRI